MASSAVPLRSERHWNARNSVKSWLARHRAITPRAVPVSIQRIAQMPFTFLGLSCIDAGVFTQSLTAGLIVTGLSFIGLEYLIADEDE